MRYPRIKDLRDNYELTQTDVAEILHVAQRTYSHYETGSHDIPTEALYLLCDFYDVSIDYLTGRSDQKKPGQKPSSRYPAVKPPALLVSEERARLKASGKKKKNKA